MDPRSKCDGKDKKTSDRQTPSAAKSYVLMSVKAIFSYCIGLTVLVQSHCFLQ